MYSHLSAFFVRHKISPTTSKFIASGVPQGLLLVQTVYNTSIYASSPSKKIMFRGLQNKVDVVGNIQNTTSWVLFFFRPIRMYVLLGRLSFAKS